MAPQLEQNLPDAFAWQDGQVTTGAEESGVTGEGALMLPQSYTASGPSAHFGRRAGRHGICFCVVHHTTPSSSVKFKLSSTAHLLTIDVADWHADPALGSAASRVRNDSLDERASRNAALVLDELALTGAKATFFVTRSIARRDVALMRRILGAGHELAAHGNAGCLDWDDLSADARATKQVLEDATGTQIRGFRSPGSRTEQWAPWRFDVLAEEGYEYDSSRMSRRPSVPDYPQTIVCGAGWLIEVPLTMSVRQFSYASLRAEFESRTRVGLPGVLSFATWEIDHEQPKMPLPVIASFRHYRGRRATRERVGRLLREFRFEAIGHRLADLAQDAPATYAA